MILRLLALSFVLSIHTGFCQQLLVLEDDRLPGPDSVLVFLPQGSRDNVRLPLVVLLHGWGGNYKQWSRIVDLQAEASKYQFVIACPDGFSGSWYIDSPAIKNSQFRSFFFDKLMKRVTTAFNVDTTNVFITGLSMGGFGAISLFLYKPEVFRAAGSTSGILELSRFPNRFGLDKAIGTFEEHEDRYHTLSPINQLEGSSLIGKTLVVDCGTEDFAYAVNQSFYGRCKSLGIDAIWISQIGRHGSDYWRKSIRQHLFLFSTLVR